MILAGEKKYDLTGYLKRMKNPKTIEQHTPEYRLKIYDFLVGMKAEGRAA
jgi:hypothetical protein